MQFKNWGLALVTTACLTIGSVGTIEAFAEETVSEPGSQTAATTASETALAEGNAIAAQYAEEAEETAAQYAPEIIELEDGTLVQRTPTEGANHTSLDTSYTYHLPGDNVPYNTYYLKADSRGCNACHADLAEQLNSMAYDHADLTNSYGIQITLQMCIDCHTFGYGYLTNQNSFGSLIHGIHSTGQADCWNCHAATGEGAGMQLWDEAKHSQLRGITPVADVQGEFSYDQDLTTPVDALFDFGWTYYGLDYLRAENTANDAPLDQDLFDNWTISITDTDGRVTTYTLPELIETFESVTLPITMHCTLNPTGGPYISNSIYTGIRLSDVLKDAGVNMDSMGGINILAPDGFIEPILVENFTETYLCYEIDGEPLPWAQGYPVQMMSPHTGAGQCVKQVSDIVVLTPEEAAELHEWVGWPRETEGTAYYTPGNWPYTNDNGYQNKPNVGLFDFTEGQVIEIGQPYEFSGYAAAWDQHIVALEFSMDGGATWTRYETPDTNLDNWVIWHFTYTPETESAYVLSIRSVSEDGSVTEEPIEVMFNAWDAETIEGARSALSGETTANDEK